METRKKKPAGPCLHPSNNKLYKRAESIGACHSGLEWLKTAKPDLRGIPTEYAFWAAWAMDEYFSHKQMMSIVRSHPGSAKYFLGRFTRADMDKLIGEIPEKMLKGCSGTMTKTQIRRAVKAAPHMVVTKQEIASACPRRMVDEQIKLNPWCAIRSLDGRFFRAEQLDFFLGVLPADTILWLWQDLSEGQKGIACRTEPTVAAGRCNIPFMIKNFEVFLHGCPLILKSRAYVYLTPAQKRKVNKAVSMLPGKSRPRSGGPKKKKGKNLRQKA